MNSNVSPRGNAHLLEQKYEQWCDNPMSVEADWAAFFEGFELGVTQSESTDSEQTATQAAPAASIPVVSQPEQLPASTGVPVLDDEMLEFRGKVVSMIYHFRRMGHTQAHVDPLRDDAELNPTLSINSFGFTSADLEREASSVYYYDGKKVPLKEMFAGLEKAFCGKIGFEFMHIHDRDVREWIIDRIEQKPFEPQLSKESISKALRWILEPELFEAFLGKKFLGEKRFSIEGGEGLLVLLNSILEKCPELKCKEIEMGMAHRGRLSVLRNFLKKSLTTILYEFTPNYVPGYTDGDGDVKYHLGYEVERKLADGKKVRVSLAANPSHLEAVNAVVEGKARARQRINHGRITAEGAEVNRETVLPVLIHGDAAMAGQGSVTEVLNLSQLPGYKTGGTVHLVVNNQIGFTTMPADARSSIYATDVAKMIDAPILHVNGESPEDLIWAAELALEFRQKFQRDIVIDMYCYRRHGHNEADQAAFTQPQTARAISQRLPAGQLYKNQLIESGSLSEVEAQNIEMSVQEELENGYNKLQKHLEAGDRSIFSESTGESQPKYSHEPCQTGISPAELMDIGGKLTTLPEGFNLHPTLAKRFIPRRQSALELGGTFDWAFAESLAWGALLKEGKPVRLSGQDVRRGTFSHRHAVFYDSNNRERYIPLNHLSEDQGKFCIYNSLLSEAAVLGFDYGYSLGMPDMLIMWEAQFGDFSNGAQVIIDQFISTAETKWRTNSSIVMLLPHGHDGMGPEHSSARPERFLQLCAKDNIIVANLTTPAQYFHVLRRQLHRDFCKPLVIMTPKSLLTRPEAVSTIEDFTDGSCFQELLPDSKTFANPEKVERVIFCTGKVFYDLVAHREAAGIENVAIIRVEQLYPFNHELLDLLLTEFTEVKDWVWCQEEPKNMGAYSFINPILGEHLQVYIKYAGRVASPSPATGFKAKHIAQQKELVEAAFQV
ncbi:2-oxoglutarate dehydrogenase E1 component [Persicirhabdus sediminis]|uniref:oxoglutarate dehydrogenase (succinyl-transferring) n=1 Tax=Persicirhabdus sediminis TaxID=454144 RepID=A0A8J7MCF7_9BACT|nr:2-oxoglutarate dehydrogenase E1 component [Persicirhabdus sediminis]MBK1790491.1 2-oxoglutarate dehydrogenase E1 component [Persicirhabdus sediminis]